MELILASPFSPLQQRIIFSFFFWILLTFMSYAFLRGFDEVYKVKYKQDNLYNIKKIKWLFVLCDYKSGKIAKHVFWLNIITHILVLSSLYFNIAFVLNQSDRNRLMSGRLTTFGLMGLLVLIAAIGIYYHSKYGEKQTEDY